MGKNHASQYANFGSLRIIERKFTKKKFPDKSTKNFFNLYVFLFGIINLLCGSLKDDTKPEKSS